MNWLLGALVVVLITLVGHGLWLIGAFFVRCLSGGPSKQRIELDDVGAAIRQLSRLRAANRLDRDTFEQLNRVLVQRRQELLGFAESPLATTTTATAATSVTGIETPADGEREEVVQAELVAEPEREDVGSVETTPEREVVTPPDSAPAAAPSPSWATATRRPVEGVDVAAEPPAGEPIREGVAAELEQLGQAPRETAPAPRRRTWHEILAAFLEERNIRWGELVGAMLIVGCSIALVVSLREQLEAIPYSRIVIFNGVTAALFGAGLYTAHRWKLEMTSYTLLMIAVLLVPLNFLAWSLTPGATTSLSGMTGALTSLGLFTLLATASASVLARRERYHFGLAVAFNGLFVLLPGWGIPSGESLPLLSAFGAMPVLASALILGDVIRRNDPGRRFDTILGRQIFTVIGTIMFSAAVALGSFAIQAGGFVVWSIAISPLVPWFALPLALWGFLLSQRLDAREEYAVWRFAGSLVATLACAAAALAVCFAWPHPTYILIVASMNFLLFSGVGMTLQRPPLHSLALANLVMAYLIAVHAAMGTLDLQGPLTSGRHVLELLLDSASSTALVGLVVLLGIAGEIIWRYRSADGAWLSGSACVLAALSVCLMTIARFVGIDGPHDLNVAAIYAVNGLSLLVLNGRWRSSAISYGGFILLAATGVWITRWYVAAAPVAWAALFAVESTVAVLFATAIHWAGRSTGRSANPDHGNGRAAWLWTVYGHPLIVTSNGLAAMALAVGATVGWHGWWSASATWGLVGATWLTSAWLFSMPALLVGAQSAVFIAAWLAGTAWLDDRRWFTDYPTWWSDPRTWHAYSVASATFVALWSTGRACVTHFSTRDDDRAWQFVGLDRLVWWFATAFQLVLAMAWMAPEVAADLVPRAIWLNLDDPTKAAAFGWTAWLALAVLAVPLLPDLRCSWRAHHLWIASTLILSALVLGAGYGLSPAGATTELRWLLAAAGLAFTAALWIRGPLAAPILQWVPRVQLSGFSRDLLLSWIVMTTTLPVVVLGVFQVTSHLMVDPMLDSDGLLARIGLGIALSVPFAVVVGTLSGASWRERIPGLQTAAGLIASLTVLCAYLVCSSSAHWVTAIQSYAAASAIWTLVWSSRGGAWRKGAGHEEQGVMTEAAGHPLAVGTAASGILVLWAWSVLFLAGPEWEPSLRYATDVAAVGSPWGWATLALLVIGWAQWQRRMEKLRWAEVPVLAAMVAVGMLACSFAALPGAWSYLILMLGWAWLAFAGVTTLWQRQQQTGNIKQDDTVIRGLARPIIVPALFAIVLAVRVLNQESMAWWSASAIWLVGLAAAVASLWRDRQRWAFCSALALHGGTCIAAWHNVAPSDDRWIHLIQFNQLAGGLAVLAWMAAHSMLDQHRSWPAARRPWLACHVALVLAAETAMLFLPACSLLVHPESGTLDMRSLSSWLGWSVWAITFFAGVFWTMGGRRSLAIDVAALAAFQIPVLLASQAVQPWQGIYTLLIGWSLISLILVLLWLAMRVPHDRWWTRYWHDRIRFVEPYVTEGTWTRWSWISAVLLVCFAVSLGWRDATLPLLAPASIAIASAVLATEAFRRQSRVIVAVSNLLLCLAAVLVWRQWDPQYVSDLVVVLAMALSGCALIWSGLRWITDATDSVMTGGPMVNSPQLASLVAVALLAGNTAATLAGELAITAALPYRSGWLLAAFGITAWALYWCQRFSPPALARGGLYVIGLCVSVLCPAFFRLELPPAQLARVLPWILGAYSLLVASTDRIASRYAEAGRWLKARSLATKAWKGLSEPERGQVDWLGVCQSLLLIVAVPATAAVLWSGRDAWERSLAAQAVTMAIGTCWLHVYRSEGIRRTSWQVAVIGMVPLVVAEWVCALWPISQLDLLFVSSVLLTSVSLTSACIALVASRRRPWLIDWRPAARPALSILVVCSLSLLILTLSLEGLAAFGRPPTEVAWPVVVMVPIALGTGMIACLLLAVSPHQDPLGLSLRGRQGYVYALELLVVLTGAHFTLTRPDWFQWHIFRDYWVLWVMAVSFAGAAIGWWFERLRLPVLAEPLANTALWLPLLPALTVWLPVGDQQSPWFWFLVALFYGYQARARRSVWWWVVAGAAANLGLWVAWTELDVTFFDSPQLWLIPPAVAVLLAEYLHHERLTREQSASIRYFALSVIYVSSTADLFMVGLGESLWLPLILGLLSVMGVFAGIWLRARPFLVLGLTFLIVDLSAMIWYAAVDLRYTWIWYLSGIILGIAIIAVFALIELRRHEIRLALQRFKQWD